MSLKQANQVINRLSENDPYFKQAAIRCWQKEMGKIQINVFVQTFENAHDLQAGYKLLRDHVAVSFQTQDDIPPAERWNIYIFYFVNEKVPLGVRQVIEQDKFSSRKMVCDHLGSNITDQIIEAQINNDLFEINIPPRPVSAITLEEMIASQFPIVSRTLSQFGNANTYEILTPLLKSLNA